MSEDAKEITNLELLERFRMGDTNAAAQLVAVFHGELRRIARAQMSRERLGHTLQPTALVNELYFKILQQKPRSEALDPVAGKLRSEADFLRLARYLMAQILIEYARSKHVVKRRHTSLPLDDALAVQADSGESHAKILSALDALEERDPELRRLVDLRYFCGYSIAETAKLLHVGQTKVKADWRLARLWLQRELGFEEGVAADEDS